jgi:hypothetical protein
MREKMHQLKRGLATMPRRESRRYVVLTAVGVLLLLASVFGLGNAALDQLINTSVPGTVVSCEAPNRTSTCSVRYRMSGETRTFAGGSGIATMQVGEHVHVSVAPNGHAEVGGKYRLFDVLEFAVLFLVSISVVIGYSSSALEAGESGAGEPGGSDLI